jgi:predicted nucleotidyltransferase
MSIRIEAKNNGTIHPAIERIFEPLKQFKGLQVFLHGSWADNTTTAFSDIDDFVIIDDIELSTEEIEHIKQALSMVQDEFFRIDPLQHHGHWKIFKSELKDYNNGVIPLFILENSICLMGSNIIEASINHHKTSNTIANSISGFCRWIEVLFTDYFNNKLNVHNLKRLVGSVVLLAPLLQQLRGKNIDKRTAILRADELFSNEALKLIQWASDLRNNWHLLTENDTFATFTTKQEKVGLCNWQKYAENNAPIIDSYQLSNISPDKTLVQSFNKECIQHLDANTLIEKTLEDYQLAYKIVEEYAIKQNAIAVGQFGETKHPGISDLDVFICFEDKDYKKAQEAMRLFIEHKQELCYVFTHPPICIAESMLAHLPYVHTINNLKINYTRKDINLNTSLSKSYTDTLNILWTLFILPGLEHEAPNADKANLRGLLLRLKNAHTSEDNLNALVGIKSDAIQQSHILRKGVFTDNKTTRTKVEHAIQKVYTKLANHGLSKQKKYCIVGRKLILKEGTYSTITDGHITIYSLPPLLYKMLKVFFYGQNKDLDLYLKAYKEIEKTARHFNAEVPAVFLLRKYQEIEHTTSKKKAIFSLLALLPFSVAKRIL